MTRPTTPHPLPPGPVKKKVRRMESETPRWWKLAGRIALDFAPPVRPCKDCGGPVFSGYCCGRCGSDEP